MYNEKKLFVKLGDFGLAYISKDSGRLASYLGTKAYMAPEIHSDKATQSYDNLCDVWSIGVMMFFCRFKRLPFGNILKNVG